jgi:hypothetical protein
MEGKDECAKRTQRLGRIAEARIRQYEAGIQDGGIVMMVEARSDDDARQIEQDWKILGGHDVYCY